MFHGFLTIDEDFPVNLKNVEFILQLIALRTHFKNFPMLCLYINCFVWIYYIDSFRLFLN